MMRRKRVLSWLVAGVALVAAIVVAPRVLRIDTWTRPTPLEGAIGVASVSQGMIVLVDGRAFRPAGVLAHPDVEPAAFDEAMRIATAQGVVVLRDLGDGRAFLQVEPKFYNWCGTRIGYGLNPVGRWAGGSFQAPLSEFLIYSGYAVPVSIDPMVTDYERWRLMGAGELASQWRYAPVELERASEIAAFRMDSGIVFLSDYDDVCEGFWQKRPAD